MIGVLTMAKKTTGEIQTREVSPLSFRAQVDAASIDEEKRTVELVWTTGARVLRGSWDPFYEELSLDPRHVRMERLASGSAPLLDSHRAGGIDSQIGVVESATLNGTEGRALVRFASDPAADSIFRKVVDKIVKNVSVGYRTYRLETIEEEDSKIPVMRATDWEPHELSMVPIGADAGATVRNEASTNPCEFVALDQEQRDMSKKTASASENPTNATSAPAMGNESQPAQAGTDTRAAIVAERERVTDIQRTATGLGLDADFAKKHIDAETSADKFRKLAFDAFEARKQPVIEGDAHPEIIPGEDARDKFMRGAGDWLLQRSSRADDVVAAAKKRGQNITIEPGEFRGMTLLDLCRESLRISGAEHRGLSKVELATQALTVRSGGMATTSDFSTLLEVALHKSLLASYGVTPDSWSRFCSVGSVSDFRAHNRYRIGSFGALDTVAEHGEFKNKAIPTGRKESITASTKGNLIGISRQAIINDDMGAFSSLSQMLGRAARLSIETDVYALLAENAGLGPSMNDGNPLFDASHANIGGGAALSTAALDADGAIMAAQTDDSSNDILDLKPNVLLVPRGLLMTAQLLNESQFEVDTSSRKAQIPNTVRGMFGDIVGTARLTGTRRYMFADPSVAPTIEVAFLDGNQAPYLELRQGWNIDGVEWKVRMDYAVGGVDYKGALTDAGV